MDDERALRGAVHRSSFILHRSNHSSTVRFGGAFAEFFQVDHQRSRRRELPAARRLVAKATPSGDGGWRKRSKPPSRSMRYSGSTSAFDSFTKSTAVRK